jgi:mannose-6-phosphate isomerase-like protein (cupin superfamily)
MNCIIPTKDTEGNPNGYLHLLWNALDQPEMRPEQVYLTVIAPGACKGPHLHYKRRGWFHAIQGHAVIVRGGIEFEMRPGSAPVEVLHGVPCCIYNLGIGEAALINMPSPAYDPNDPDEHVPENWQHPDWWRHMHEAR